jgi:hypothetical protein
LAVNIQTGEIKVPVQYSLFGGIEIPSLATLGYFEEASKVPLATAKADVLPLSSASPAPTAIDLLNGNSFFGIRN